MGSGNSAHLVWVQVGCEVHMAVSCVAANSLGWMDQRRMSEGQVLTGGWILGPGWVFQNKINSASQPCVLDSELLILIESSFRAHYFPCLKGFQESVSQC